MCRQLEIPATIFFWTLAVEISFLPTMIHHHFKGGTARRDWEIKMNKVLVSILVGASLNFIEKIIIQLIAISFHLRTYSDRIELNKFQIGSLTKLYQYSKEKIEVEDSDFEEHPASGQASGARTPMQYVEKAQKQARGVFNKFGDVAGKVRPRPSATSGLLSFPVNDWSILTRKGRWRLYWEGRYQEYASSPSRPNPPFLYIWIAGFGAKAVPYIRSGGSGNHCLRRLKACI